MFRDFLIGTVGKFIQVICGIGGFLFLIGGIFGGSVGSVIFGIILLCMTAGIRYALGHIYRQR